ncbi:MAG: RidA family protein [Planctomycetes bacterium]|nr:RidA family protein [Planctomycetota bacterium]
MKAHHTPDAPAAIGPYSQAVEAGGFLFASGQVALRPDGSLVDGGVREQTEQVLKNLDAVLTAAGCGRADVVKCTVFLTDLGDFLAMNEVYGAFFGDHKPARACVEVSRLPKDVAVEIELVAQCPGAPR